MAEQVRQNYVAELAQALAGDRRRLTGARLSVLKILAETGDHLSAETIYDRLRQQGNITSRASVYRALKLLEDKELIRRIPVKEGSCRFEYAGGKKERKIRCHFVCQRCKQIFDIEAPGLRSLLQRLPKPLKIEVHDYEVRLSGTCSRCTEELKREKG